MLMRISTEKMLSEKTLLDNAFIANYMPFAPESYVKVYISGLFAATFGTAGVEPLEYISNKLSIDPTVVDEAFRYWESQGVINYVRSNPPLIEFLPVDKALPSMRKFSKAKYKDFNDQLHAAYPQRNILPNEYNEYYTLMEDSHLEPEAMLAIISYCIRQKGQSITYPYILTVARNLIGQGLLTFDRVSENLSECDMYEKDLKPVLTVLGMRRKPDHEDNRLFIKWTKGMGFSSATVIKVAKTIKRGGGMEKLDSVLTKYYENHLTEYEDIERYNEDKEKLYSLAKDINRIIGVYYEQLDFIIETYINRWLELGFNAQTLVTVATYCFKRSIRSLEGMNDAVEKFYKQGLITAESIDSFIDASVRHDNRIKKAFEHAGISRNITARDRDSFRVWSDTWGMSDDMICLSAEKAKGSPNPIAYMNSILSAWFKAGIASVEGANAFKPESAPASDNKVTKTYTSEQLNALFDNLD